jgi:porin
LRLLTPRIFGRTYTSRTDRVEAAGAPDGGDRNRGIYGYVERKLLTEADDRQGLSGWVRLGVADPALNAIASYVGAGLVYTGLFAKREGDALGFAVGSANFGAPYRREQARMGTPTDRRELNLELTYRARLTRWLTAQPDVQYVINPGGNTEIDDALVLGLRFEFGF